MPEIVGEYLDRLATVEMRRLGQTTLRGTTRQIYDVILKKQGKPATTLAASRLIDTLSEGDFAFFMTGAGVPPWLPKGEVDGPPGIAAVARALYLGRGILPVFVVAEHHADITVATLDGMGLNVLPLELATTRFYPAAVVEVMPYGADEGGTWAAGLFDRYQAKAVVTSEILGPNELGVTHSGTGVLYEPEWNIDAAKVLNLAASRAVTTVSIGDGGNELGYGTVHEQINEIQGWKRCQCPCGGGVACVVPADVLVHAANSDWGGYALAAAIAFLLRDSRLLVSRDLQTRALEACVAAGARGLFGRQVHIGGTGLETQLAFVHLMRELIETAAIEKWDRPF